MRNTGIIPAGFLLAGVFLTCNEWCQNTEENELISSNN